MRAVYVSAGSVTIDELHNLLQTHRENTNARNVALLSWVKLPSAIQILISINQHSAASYYP